MYANLIHLSLSCLLTFLSQQKQYSLDRVKLQTVYKTHEICDSLAQIIVFLNQNLQWNLSTFRSALHFIKGNKIF